MQYIRVWLCSHFTFQTVQLKASPVLIVLALPTNNYFEHCLPLLFSVPNENNI